MDKQELLRQLAITNLIKSGQVGINTPSAPPLLNKPVPSPLPEIQLQDIPIGSTQVDKLSGPEAQSTDPMTQIDPDALRKEALERIKNRDPQKLKFRGGVLERNNVYNND